MSSKRFALAVVLALAAGIGTAHAGSKQRPTLPRKNSDARVAVAIYEFTSNLPEISPRGATEQFKTALVQSGQFRVVERAKLDRGVVREKQMNAAGQTTGSTSQQQPARHTITETGGMRLDIIVAGGKTYTKMDGKWRRHGNTDNSQAAAKELNAAIRSGKYPMSGCRKLGPQSVDGIPTIGYAYTLKIPGMPGGEAKAFIGSDGLVHAQSTPDAKVRIRYRGVTAPAL